MIKTKDLEGFLRDVIDFSGEVPDIQDLYGEYIAEIVARLKHYDELTVGSHYGHTGRLIDLVTDDRLLKKGHE